MWELLLHGGAPFPVKLNVRFIIYCYFVALTYSLLQVSDVDNLEVTGLQGGSDTLAGSERIKCDDCLQVGTVGEG